MSYEIGDPHIPAIKTYTATTQYSYRSNNHEIALALPDPLPAKIQELKECKIEVAFYMEDDVICFLYCFQNKIAWSEMPFSFHLMPEAEQSLPSDPDLLMPVERDRVEIVFVNAVTKRVVGLKSAMFSHLFTVRLRAAIISQASKTWPGRAMWDRQLRQIHARYTTSKSLLIDCEAHCTLEGLATRW
jgi:hypothetical protein